MNAPNHLPLQNNYPGQVGPAPQSGQSNGFAPNMNPMLQNMNQMPHFQSPIQFGMPPNGQFVLNNPTQNANQFLGMQVNHLNQVPQSMGVPNPPVFGNPQCRPFVMNQPGNNAYPNHHLGYRNQLPQSTAPQNVMNHGQVVPPPYYLPYTGGLPSQVVQSMGPNSPHLMVQQPSNIFHQHMSQMQPNSAACNMGGNVFNQLQGSVPPPPTFGAVRPQHHAHNGTQPHHNGFQMNNVKEAGGGTFRDSSCKNSSSQNFNRNPQKKGLAFDASKCNSHNKQNMKGKFGKNRNGQKGPVHQKAGKLNSTNESSGSQRRSLNYTEQEIQQWKEERKKNYPSKINIEKKLRHKLTGSELSDEDAKLRRQQLKDILAKQAELGLEVAEIPAHYLSDSEKQGSQVEDREILSNKRKFGDKYNRRGRRDCNGRSAKQKMKTDLDDIKDSHNKHPVNRREPTLFQKLLTTDVRRERNSLLQVFRFMVMNSFLNDWPEKPLNFPKVLVKETECGTEVIANKPVLAGKGLPEQGHCATSREGEDLSVNAGDANTVAEALINEKDSVQAESEDSEEGEISN